MPFGNLIQSVTNNPRSKTLLMPAIVAHSFPVWLPQTQTWLYHQVRFLPETVSSHIICKETLNLDQFGLPRIHSLSGPSSFTGNLSTKVFHHLDYHLYLRRKCRIIAPDILHSHFGPIGWKNMRVLKAGFNYNLQKIRHVVTFYGQDVDHLPTVRPAWRKRYIEMFQNVDMVLCEGTFMANKVELLGCPPDRIQIHHLGVDLEAIPFGLRIKNPNEPFRILMAAAFRPKKGFIYGLRALDRLAEHYDLRITLVGDSTDDPESKQEKEHILNFITNSRIADKVTLTGFLSEKSLRDVARQHHIYLAPSVTADGGDSEGGVPVSLIEMAASGMPVISSFHCDIPEVIVHGETGFLAPEKDVDRLTELLENLLSKPDSWSGIAEQARNRIEQSYNAVKQGQRLSNLYELMLYNNMSYKCLHHNFKLTHQPLSISRPRVLFISHSSELYGAERSLLSLVEGLQEMGLYDLRVLLPSEGPLREALEAIGITCMISPYERWVGLRLHYIARYWRRLLNQRRFNDMLKIVKAWNPDLVYSNTIATGAGIRLIECLPHRPKHIIHARELPGHPSFGYFDLGERRTYKLLARYGDRLICNSLFLKKSLYPFLDDARKRLRNTTGIRDEFDVVYNGFICASDEDKQNKSVGIDTDNRLNKQFKMIMAGGISPGKNYIEAVKAVQLLKESGVSVRLEIYGDGPKRAVERLRLEINKAGVAEYVILNGYHNNIGTIISDADMLLITSRMETFGRIAVEAMLAGCPVIGTNAGGLPEIISDGETGLLYKPGDIHDLASKIKSLRDDPKQRARLAEASRIYALSAFSIDRYIRQIHTIIQEELPLNKRIVLTESKIDI